MAKKGKEEKIRVHNKGSRTYEYKNEKGELKKIESGRAVEVPESRALKMIEKYPRDLVNFEDMLSGDRKDINKENKRLKKEVADLTAQIAESGKTAIDAIMPEVEEEKKELTDQIEKLEEQIKVLIEGKEPEGGE